LHGFGGDLRHDQGEGIVRARFDRAEKRRECRALIGAPRRALAFGIPSVADVPLLADARFVLEKQADRLVRMRLANRLQAVAEPPLKAA
jgi:hypothetical protein